jgi:hypothetical protein
VRVNRGLLGWGLFFIVMGLVPLAVRNGVVDPAQLERAFGLWPLLLIGIGLAILLRDTKAAALGGLVVAVTFGLMAGAVVAGATSFGSIVGPCSIGGDANRGDPFPGRSGTFTGPAGVQLEMRCGSVDATTGSGTGWSLEGTAGSGLEPVVATSDTRLRVSAPEQGNVRFGEAPARWKVTLPDGVPLDLSTSVDAGSADLALDATQVTRADVSVNAGDSRIGLARDGALRSLQASVNAGSLTLDLPAASFQGRISVNAGSAEACIPEGTALRVRADDVTLGSTNLGSRGLVQTGSTWMTPGYTSATVQVDLDVSVNLGSFTLNPENGCG